MKHFSKLFNKAVIFFDLLSTSSAMILTRSITSTTLARLGIQPVASPTVTSYPRLDLRQEVTLQTCGYIGGDANAPVTCAGNLFCATTSTFVGCCETGSCIALFTTCYNNIAPECNAACQNNLANLICPTARPWCARYNYEGGSVGWGCMPYTGYTTTVLLSSITKTFGSLSFSTSTSTSTTAPASTSNSSLGAGAIAGITIGSVVAVVLVFAVAFLYWRVRRIHPAPDRTGPGPAPPYPHDRSSYVISPTSATYPPGSTLSGDFSEIGTSDYPSSLNDEFKRQSVMAEMPAKEIPTSPVEVSSVNYKR